MLERLIELFQELPRLTQIGIVLGIVAPLLALRGYFTPPPPPPKVNPKETFIIGGEVTTKKK